jgi:hypothetical protein
MSTGTWMADGALCLLLLGTLVMSIRLDRGLRLVRRDRGAFETLIGSLGSATQAVSVGVQRLRSESERAAELIQRRSEEADRLATDLSFLIDRAERSGRRIEGALRDSAQADEGDALAAGSVGAAPPHSLAAVAEMVRGLATAKSGRRA